MKLRPHQWKKIFHWHNDDLVKWNEIRQKKIKAFCKKIKNLKFNSSKEWENFFNANIGCLAIVIATAPTKIIFPCDESHTE